MKLLRLLTGIGLSAFVFCNLTLAHAATPLWTFTPLTATSITLALNGSAIIQYKITNQSHKPHTLQFVPIQGVSQITGSGNCATSFTLGQQQSCILNLQVTANLLSSNVEGGPTVCQQGNMLQCYRPSLANRLTIIVDYKQAFISVIGSPLTLVRPLPGTLQIVNTSTALTATNVQADFTGTPLEGNVTQDASGCVSVLPGGTCTLNFTPGVSNISLTSFPIRGGNTNQASGQIEVISPAGVSISVQSGSPLTLQATTGTPAIGTLTIKNNSSLITATNISANLSGALTGAGVTQNSSNCNVVPPLGTCNLVFTPGTQAVSNTSVNIQGSNTSVTSASIAVNGAPQASITLTAGSPLTLNTNQTGSMTIQNNSTTENALGMTANFTSTALNGLVMVTGGTCTTSPSGIPPNATCTLVFTAGSTSVASTNFPIQGSNTSSVNGNITIINPTGPIIFVTNSTSNGNLGGYAGANARCNADSAKPTTGFAAAFAYKALLNGNNATTSGLTYKRTDGLTIIAVATGGDLRGLNSLTNSIATSGNYAWTGYNSGGPLANCSNWTVADGSITGYGQPFRATSFYLGAGNSSCSTGGIPLYCVSQ
jgi:hypothetical protein